MSLECAECERDVRGGHAVSCSLFDPTLCECGHDADEHTPGDVCWADCACRSYAPREARSA